MEKEIIMSEPEVQPEELTTEEEDQVTIPEPEVSESPKKAGTCTPNSISVDVTENGHTTVGLHYS